MDTIDKSSTNNKEVLGHIDDNPQTNYEIIVEARKETAKYMIHWKEMKLEERRAWTSNVGGKL
eukprot:3324748-Ditylum_brightwellii.AAC.1